MSYRHPISPSGSPQKMTITSSSTQSTVLSSSTKLVRLCADTDCWIVIGANPTAALTSVYLPAKVPQVFGCEPSDKVAVIGTSGSLYISEAFSAV